MRKYTRQKASGQYYFSGMKREGAFLEQMNVKSWKIWGIYHWNSQKQSVKNRGQQTVALSFALTSGFCPAKKWGMRA